MDSTRLEVPRGDGVTIKVTAAYPDAVPEQNVDAGDPYPLSGKTLYFTARNRFNEASTVVPVFAKTTGSGITVRSDPNDHIADITIASDDTEDLAVKKLYWDFRSKAGSADPITLAEGVLVILPNATRI